MIDFNDLTGNNSVITHPLNHPFLQETEVAIDVLRLDKIHTIISGNKWFKLKYYLQDVIKYRKKGIVTMGGAYSNHILAVAYACREAGVGSIGIIRGEDRQPYSPTLQDAMAYGMTVRFLDRTTYSGKTIAETLSREYAEYLFVEEGGRGPNGIKGAEEILHLYSSNKYSHIICAVGTGTMMTGLINSASPDQKVIGIPVLKLPDFHASDIFDYIGQNSTNHNYTFQTNFHFGGYAKRNPELIRFMNTFFAEHNIPTDWIYTGKLFYAAMAMVRQGFFDRGAKILIIHSGGLQGNRSLQKGLLTFHS